MAWGTQSLMRQSPAGVTPIVNALNRGNRLPPTSPWHMQPAGPTMPGVPSEVLTPQTPPMGGNLPAAPVTGTGNMPIGMLWGGANATNQSGGGYWSPQQMGMPDFNINTNLDASWFSPDLAGKVGAWNAAAGNPNLRAGMTANGFIPISNALYNHFNPNSVSTFLSDADLGKFGNIYQQTNPWGAAGVPTPPTSGASGPPMGTLRPGSFPNTPPSPLANWWDQPPKPFGAK